MFADESRKLDAKVKTLCRDANKLAAKRDAAACRRHNRPVRLAAESVMPHLK
jgi:hypothetical protein